jgi:hypothetical protein
LTRHLPRLGGLLQLERTGPFVPAISFPGVADIVVTDPIKRALCERLSELSFKPVKKSRIVKLHWEGWPAAQPEPAILPESGEPEDYILTADHDPETADALGGLRELVPRVP